MIGNLALAAVVLVTLFSAWKVFGPPAAERRRPPVVTACRSHVRKVTPIVSAGGPVREEGRGSSAPSTPADTSLAADAYWSLAGGTELEAKIEKARRSLKTHRTFGDQALRRSR